MRAFDAELRRTIAAHLGAFERTAITEASLMRAAVAIAIVRREDGRASFLLTRRADRPGRHAGQWALPGGRAEPDETPQETALRELAEEVGVVAGPAEVLGLLDDYETRSGFVITPVVVFTEFAGELTPDPSEVAAAYRVPLDELEGPEVPVIWSIPESTRPVLAIPIAEVDTLVHAPTAALLYQLREVALAGRPTRVAHYEQPVFAWR